MASDRKQGEKRGGGERPQGQEEASAPPQELEQSRRHEEAQQPPLPNVDAMIETLHAELERQERSFLSRLKALPTRTRLWWLWGSILAVAAFNLVAKPRSDLGHYPLPRMALAIGALLVITAPLLRRALGDWHRPDQRGRALGLTVVATAIAVGLAALPPAHVLLPHTAPPLGVPLLGHVLPCLLYGLTFGGVIFALCRALSRDLALSALVATAVTGVVGNLALQLHCPITEQTHLLLGHAMVGVAALALALPAAFMALRRPAD